MEFQPLIGLQCRVSGSGREPRAVLAMPKMACMSDPGHHGVFAHLPRDWRAASWAALSVAFTWLCSLNPRETCPAYVSVASRAHQQTACLGAQGGQRPKAHLFLVGPEG